MEAAMLFLTDLWKYRLKVKNDLDFKVFNLVRKKYEAVILVKHNSFDCKCTSGTMTCNSNQKCNNEKWQCECK